MRLIIGEKIKQLRATADSIEHVLKQSQHKTIGLS